MAKKTPFLLYSDIDTSTLPYGLPSRPLKQHVIFLFALKGSEKFFIGKISPPYHRVIFSLQSDI